MITSPGLVAPHSSGGSHCDVASLVDAGNDRETASGASAEPVHENDAAALLRCSGMAGKSLL